MRLSFPGEAVFIIARADRAALMPIDRDAINPVLLTAALLL
jgi:hypothetical protein